MAKPCRKCSRPWRKCDNDDALCLRFKPRRHPSDGGEVRCMVAVDGYVMVRRPGCMPFVLALSKWDEWVPVEDYSIDMSR